MTRGRRDVPVCVDGQVYARVTKMLGSGRLMATGADGVERLCKIRGSMQKREWVRIGDTVLVALRDFDAARGDVVFRYNAADVQRLRRLGEAVEVPGQADEEDEGVVVFADDDDDADRAVLADVDIDPDTI